MLVDGTCAKQQNVILMTHTVSGTTTTYILSIFGGIHMSVFLWTDFVVASQPYKIQSEPLQVCSLDQNEGQVENQH